jgi:isoamylase
MGSGAALRLVADSLRYWVTEMRVDGFRFDLATTLGREHGPFDRNSAFFKILQQDPVLSQVKLIAEPWDVGDGGYQVGGFPAPWGEWNGKYRDCVRDFWKGGEAGANTLAQRMTGSSDLYNHSGRAPTASVNFVCAHDGFTLHDLVSYNDKHNEANGEENRDGDNNNHSWNCGSEGPTDDQEILKLRRRQMRNLFATLLLSQGVPMINGGDEIARTQRGNNNAYCQDTELSWFSWDLTPEQEQLREFVSRLIALRQAHPQFHRHEFFNGRSMRGTGIKDIVWLNPEGQEMVASDWEHGIVRCVGALMNGQALDMVDEKGEHVKDATFLLLLNGHHEQISFTLPTWHAGSEKRWKVLVDTNLESGFPDAAEPQALEHYELAPRCLVLLEWLLEE